MRDVVAIGASAGGVEALRKLMAGFPDDWSAAIFVVIHLPADAVSMLPDILSRAGPLPARHPEDGAKVQRGVVYVAPPDHHMVLLDDRVRLNRGPKQNRHRPSVDALFRSVAYSCGPRAIGAVLTGTLSDGSVGLSIIRSRGGATVVQDPRDAEFPSMPRSALQRVQVDHCVPLSEMAPLLVRLSKEPVPAAASKPSKELEMEVRHDQGELNVDLDQIGKPSYFTCPECKGTLWEIQEGSSLARYRCRVGHGYSTESLMEHMDETLEDSLWAAARALVENAHLKERVAQRLVENGQRELAEKLRAEAKVTQQRAETIRQLFSGEKIRS